jgi:hypothetical protein
MIVCRARWASQVNLRLPGEGRPGPVKKLAVTSNLCLMFMFSGLVAR